MKNIYDHIEQPETIGFGHLRFEDVKQPLGKDSKNLLEHEKKQIEYLKEIGSELDDGDTTSCNLVDVVNSKTGQTVFQIYTYPYDDGAVFKHGTTDMVVSICQGGFDIEQEVKTNEQRVQCYKLHRDISKAEELAGSPLVYSTGADAEEYLEELEMDEDIDLTKTKAFKAYEKELDKIEFVYQPDPEATEVNIASKRLKTVPEEVFLQDKLEILNLCNNQLEELPADIGKLTKLKILYLGDNKLKTLPKEIGNLINLEKLYISYSPIESFPAEFGRLTKLTKLVLSASKLKDLPEEVANLISLESIQFDGAFKRNLPKNFGLIPNVKELNFFMTGLKKIDKSIRNMKSLEKINYQGCSIKVLPEWLTELKNMKELILRNNYPEPRNFRSIMNAQDIEKYFAIKELRGVDRWKYFFNNLIEGYDFFNNGYLNNNNQTEIEIGLMLEGDTNYQDHIELVDRLLKHTNTFPETENPLQNHHRFLLFTPLLGKGIKIKDEWFSILPPKLKEYQTAPYNFPSLFLNAMDDKLREKYLWENRQLHSTLAENIELTSFSCIIKRFFVQIGTIEKSGEELKEKSILYRDKLLELAKNSEEITQIIEDAKKEVDKGISQ